MNKNSVHWKGTIKSLGKIFVFCEFLYKFIGRLLKIYIPAGDLIWRLISIAWVFVKVGQVHVIFDRSFEWSIHRSLEQLVPIESIEPPTKIKKDPPVEIQSTIFI